MCQGNRNEVEREGGREKFHRREREREVDKEICREESGSEVKRYNKDNSNIKTII